MPGPCGSVASNHKLIRKYGTKAANNFCAPFRVSSIRAPVCNFLIGFFINNIRNCSRAFRRYSLRAAGYKIGIY